MGALAACAIAGGSHAQPDFTAPASFGTALPSPFIAAQYYAVDLDVADFTGATGTTIDGFLDVGVFSGPLGTGTNGNYPEEDFSSVITLFRNTQNWGTGSAPTSALQLLTTIDVCDNCLAGEMQFVDMNNDAFPDIVATSTTLTGDGEIHVFLYDQNLAQFIRKEQYSGGGTNFPSLQALGVGDFDGDGYSDIVASVHRDVLIDPDGGDAYDHDFVYKLKNIDDGSGYGALSRIFPDIAVTGTPGVADFPSGEIVVGEFNTLQGFPGSVRPEFITAEASVPSLTLGSGFGSFGFTLSDQPYTFPCGNISDVDGLAFNSMAAGKINAGVTLDLVACGSSGPEAYVLLGNGRGGLLPVCINGTYQGTVNLQINPACAEGGGAPPENVGDYFLTLGYINDDTYIDIILADGDDFHGERYAGIALGDGDGTFTVGTDCGHWLIYADSIAELPEDRVITANMDNSGHDEVLVLASWENSLVVFKNND